jgi:hypothetical protein
LRVRLDFLDAVVAWGSSISSAQVFHDQSPRLCGETKAHARQ